MNHKIKPHETHRKHTTMKKRLFQVLDEMNQHDAENNTQLVTLHPDVVSINQTKKGTHVTMGVPLGIIDPLDNKK